MAELYAYMGFLAVLLTFGLETGYFRFRSGGELGRRRGLCHGAAFPAPGQPAPSSWPWWCSASPSRTCCATPDHPEYIWWSAAILALDSVGCRGLRPAAGGGARAALRPDQGDRDRRQHRAQPLLHPALPAGLRDRPPDPCSVGCWDPAIGIGYVFLANLAASGFKLLLLLARTARDALGGFDRALFRRLMPLLAPHGDHRARRASSTRCSTGRRSSTCCPTTTQTNMAQLGIYSACYKLSILMTLFIQAFRYAGRALLLRLRQGGGRRAHLCPGAQLVRHLLRLHLPAGDPVPGPLPVLRRRAYREGLHVVPVLLLANLLLGIYVNLSIWYKLTDRTLMGAWVTLVGSDQSPWSCLFWWVPIYGYEGAAWAHLACYGFMVAAVLSARPPLLPGPLRPAAGRRLCRPGARPLRLEPAGGGAAGPQCPGGGGGAHGPVPGPGLLDGRSGPRAPGGDLRHSLRASMATFASSEGVKTAP